MNTRTCQCTSYCGDDEEVKAGRVLGCTTYRARHKPADLAAQVRRLRGNLQALVELMDRMEPDVPEDERASDDEWIAIKAVAVQTLAEIA